MTKLCFHTSVENANFDMVIKAEEIVKIFAHFGASMPVMFLTTTPRCAASIRNRCRMNTKAGPFYDPGSKGEYMICLSILKVVRMHLH